MRGKRKEKRSLFERIFRRKPKESGNYRPMMLLNGYSPTFITFSGNAYESDVVRSAVDAIARNAAKLKPRHIRRTDGRIEHINSPIERMLSIRPNPYMSSYDFYYKIVTLWCMKNNSFVYIHHDDNGRVAGFYPLDYSHIEFLEISDNPDSPLFVRFRFLGGQQLTTEYSNIIHLRRFFYTNDLFGEPNDKAITSTLELINTTNQGIINAVRQSASLRGLLKFTSALRPEDIKKQADLFVEDYLTIANQGGIAAIDSKSEYIELKNDPKMVDDEQMKLVEQKVYKYFGINENIIMANYTEDQWNSFYESVLEPMSLMMSQEFTSKLFSDQSINRGNEIIFEANRLQYASNRTKIEVITTLMDRGMLTKNEALDIFNLPPIPDGDKRIMSLNFIDADEASKYQLGKAGLQDQAQEVQQEKGGENDDNPESGEEGTDEPDRDSRGRVW